MSLIYLDYAAATPVDDDVIESMLPYQQEVFYNPSAIYEGGVKAKNALESARANIASTLGVRPTEIIFTAGGSEANNLAIQGIAKSLPKGHVVYTSLEHESVIAPIKSICKDGYSATEVKPKENGIIDVNMIQNAITNNTTLVSVMYANNEIGTIQPIRDIGLIIDKIRKARAKSGNKTPIYFHTDACQSGNYLNLNMHRLGVDMMTLNGSKIYGPKQSGVLAVLSLVSMKPIIYGGGQEYGRRSGTENVAGCIGLATALVKAKNTRQEESSRLTTIRDMFIERILKNAKISLNGSKRNRLPNNIHLTIKGVDNERLIYALDERGIQCAAGSACSASKEEPSHVLTSIGLSNKDAQSSIRLTMGRQTTDKQMTDVMNVLLELI